jgi:xyloglucan:xyloglucosyl transferase
MESNRAALLLLLLAVTIQAAVAAQPFTANYLAETDTFHTRVLNAGARVDLVLDKTSAAAFGSKGNYLFGSIGMGIKLVPGNSAGTVTAYYLSSAGAQHDEMDFEFLGNKAGEPYILQTNVFAKGKGSREQRINLWFDPTADFHTYSLLWNKNMIVFYVDTTPIRVFKNNEDLGVPFPNSQGVGIYASLWDGSSWATDGGKVGLDWNAAPFVASFQGFGIDSCEVKFGVNACKNGNQWWQGAAYQDLNANQIGQLKNVRSKHMIYDYCTDQQRTKTAPVECARNWYE